MTRYYPGQRPPPPKEQKHSFKQSIWVMGAFLSGYFLSALFDVASLKQFINTQLIGVYYNKPLTQVVAQAPTPIAKPKLEFYTLLTKDTLVPSEKVDESKSVEVKADTKHIDIHTTPSSDKEPYTVQLAAFGNKQDAEHMKASLVLRGVSVSIIAAEQNHIQWYRVILGPFPSKEDAEAAMQSLAKRERINGMLRKASA